MSAGDSLTLAAGSGGAGGGGESGEIVGGPRTPQQIAAQRRLQQTQAQVDEVVDIMKTNVEKVLERDQKLSELDDRADALQQGASQFEQQAGKLKRKFWLQNLKMMIIMGVIVVIILIIIIMKFMPEKEAVAPQAPMVPAIQQPVAVAPGTQVQPFQNLPTFVAPLPNFAPSPFPGPTPSDSMATCLQTNQSSRIRTMRSHTTSVFNNNCLKVPRNPRAHQPSPIYEQTSELQLEMPEKGKRFVDRKSTRDFVDFVNNIPEYDEVNHLSNKEFYNKLEKLKERQRLYEEHLRNEIRFDAKDSEWIEDYKEMKLTGKKSKRKPSLKPFCATPILTKPKEQYDEFPKPSSRRSVRIETPSSEKFSTPEPTTQPPRPKSRIGAGAQGGSDWEDLSVEDLNLCCSDAVESRSAPSSPARASKGQEWDGITIPKPFQMTVRDEEDKIVEELFLKLKKPKEEKSEQFKAHDIPIESQIPLFDKIMEDQRRRSFITKEKRKAALQAQMKPFSFTKRDEEIQELTKQLSQSSPSLLEPPPLRIKKFKAKPVPKNLFSNYIYRKMHEDEYYRALQKKIRAEELLRASSLPPSMAKREKTSPKFEVCPRSYRDSPAEEKGKKKSKKTSTMMIPDYKKYHECLEKELEELKNEFISTSPRPFKFKTSKRARKSCRNSSAGSKTTSTSCKTPSSFSMDFPYLNRSNLAAVLRIQSARQKLEMEMMKKLEEAKLKEEARWREKLMRKKPVWQSLAYSHEEDLAMRLQLRRDEERLRNEEHRMRMHMMLGRVNQQPTLFERQSHTNCPKTKDELVKQLYKEYGLTKTKGEKEAKLLEEIEKYETAEGSKESDSVEEKEKCDCFSVEDADDK